MNVSDEILKRTADSYRRIRNTARFMLSNLSGFKPETDIVAHEELVALDRWAVARAAKLQDEILASYDSYQLHQIYQKLHKFCVVDMGGFYLDIIKDRQYTAKADGHARRSAQTALYHISHAFVRWIAPILSFTADELWTALPAYDGSEVFVQEWMSLPSLSKAEPISEDNWERIAEVKQAVNKLLEEKRKEGLIGKSLEAEVVLYCDEALKTVLEALEDELRFVLITSSAQLAPLAEAKDAVATELAGLKLEIVKTQYEKCERCWHHSEDIGQHEAHPTICGRCVVNIDGDGELRHYA